MVGNGWCLAWDIDEEVVTPTSAERWLSIFDDPCGDFLRMSSVV